jgi:hypothetical protein
MTKNDLTMIRVMTSVNKVALTTMFSRAAFAACDVNYNGSWAAEIIADECSILDAEKKLSPTKYEIENSLNFDIYKVVLNEVKKIFYGGDFDHRKYMADDSIYSAAHVVLVMLLEFNFRNDFIDSKNIDYCTKLCNLIEAINKAVIDLFPDDHNALRFSINKRDPNGETTLESLNHYCSLLR